MEKREAQKQKADCLEGGREGRREGGREGDSTGRAEGMAKGTNKSKIQRQNVMMDSTS